MMIIRMLQGTVYRTGPVVNSNLFYMTGQQISVFISESAFSSELQIHLKDYKKRGYRQ